MEDFKIDVISLKKHGAKEWQFKDCTITRVELAVLDYLKDQGWSGYFTENENFEELLIKMMCWEDHSNFPWSFDGDISKFSIQTVNCMFLKAADGYWSYDQKYTSADLLNNAKTFDAKDIASILRLWGQQKIKFGKSKQQFLKKEAWQDLCNLSANDLAAYYTASGGRDYFLSLLEQRFPPKQQVLWDRARKLFDELKISCREKKDHQALMTLVIGLQGTDISTYLGITSSANPENLSGLVAEIDDLPKSDLVNRYLQLAKDIKTLTDELGSLSWYKRNREHAVLDLKVWKDGQMASIEVKAPNDRLRPNQKAQLLQDKEQGNLSWVIEVHDGTIKQAALELKNNRKAKRTKLKSLADLSDELKSVGIWDDNIKDAIYQLTLGRDVSNWDELCAKLAEFPHIITSLNNFKSQKHENK